MRINKNLKKIKFELDEDDLIFFEKIKTSHPKAVKYQDLMNMLDNSLAYETKIKKIGASKLRIDFVLSKYCKSKDSILQSKKNIDDSRIKEMFIKHFFKKIPFHNLDINYIYLKTGCLLIKVSFLEKI